MSDSSSQENKKDIAKPIIVLNELKEEQNEESILQPVEPIGAVKDVIEEVTEDSENAS